MGPVPRVSRTCSRRSSNAFGASTRVRAAASSIASGSPSRRRQISMTAAALASSRVKSWRTGPVDEQAHSGECVARSSSGGRSANAGTISASTGYSRSARRRSTVRLVRRIVTSGHAVRSWSSSTAAPVTCSRLSRTSSGVLRGEVLDQGVERGACPRSAHRPRRRRGSTSAGSVIDASATNSERRPARRARRRPRSPAGSCRCHPGPSASSSARRVTRAATTARRCHRHDRATRSTASATNGAAAGSRQPPAPRRERPASRTAR